MLFFVTWSGLLTGVTSRCRCVASEPRFHSGARAAASLLVGTRVLGSHSAVVGSHIASCSDASTVRDRTSLSPERHLSLPSDWKVELRDTTRTHQASLTSAIDSFLSSNRRGRSTFPVRSPASRHRPI
ncbi:hypothetical protein C8T65DRAFT_275225 [Cerioporus squamosus]|nr:hypothetical protein C8T65DRAFT_275225 [Cerioporus squamosus]